MITHSRCERTTASRSGRPRLLLQAMATLALVAALPTPAMAQVAPLPIFDAHIHYSHDAWDNLPPQGRDRDPAQGGRSGARWCRARATRARSGSSPPRRSSSCRRCGPIARAARSAPGCATRRSSRSSRSGWRASRYAAIGEFHLYGADADLPVSAAHGRAREGAPAGAARALGRRRDRAAVPAGSGRAHPVGALGLRRPDGVRAMLRKHRNLWCDLAFRSDQGAGGKVPAEWRALFTEFPDRFMVGTDTFTPERWHYIVEHANWSRAWLADLPPPLAERIAWRNGEALFAGWKPAPRNEVSAHCRDCGASPAPFVRSPSRRTPAACGESAADGRRPRDRTRATRSRSRTMPAPIAVGGTFALDIAVCPRAGAAPPTARARRRGDAGAPARHELPARRSLRAAPAPIAPRACCSTCRGAGTCVFDVVTGAGTERLAATLRLE